MLFLFMALNSPQTTLDISVCQFKNHLDETAESLRWKLKYIKEMLHKRFESGHLMNEPWLLYCAGRANLSNTQYTSVSNLE